MTKIQVTSESRLTDFVTPQRRLNKKQSSLQKTLEAIEITLYIILATFVVYFVLSALKFWLF